MINVMLFSLSIWLYLNQIGVIYKNEEYIYIWTLFIYEHYQLLKIWSLWLKIEFFLLFDLLI